MTADFTLVLSQQLTGNSYQFCEKVGLTCLIILIIIIYDINVAFLFLVTYPAGLCKELFGLRSYRRFSRDYDGLIIYLFILIWSTGSNSSILNFVKHMSSMFQVL